MRINYKKELEEAARNMILVHKPYTLMRMILRMIVRKVNIEHAGILLYDRTKNSYTVSITRGKIGSKMPAGLFRLDPQSPMIRFFKERRFAALLDNNVLLLDKINSILQRRDSFNGNEDFEKMLIGIKFQMKSFDAVVCVPSYYHNDLLGVLLLGEKVKKRVFKKEEIDFFVALANDVAMALRNAFLFEGLKAEMERNKDLFFETTLAFSAAIDAKDHYTRGHTMRVTEYSLAIARFILEQAQEKMGQIFFDNLHIASLLHDIGKIGISENILNKIENLDADERRIMNEHPIIGAKILEPIKGLEEVIKGVKYHHEQFDGNGFPDGLKGDDVPLIASIIAVADSLDAMTTDRPYRKALTREQAIEELKRCSGTQFHPKVVKAALALANKGVI